MAFKTSNNHINPLNTSVCTHIETNQLICIVNQSTGLYMKVTLVFNGWSTFKAFENE